MTIFSWAILLACAAPQEIPWISDGVELQDGSSKFPDAPAVDRGGLLEQAKTVARERNRLILWYCPRVAGTHMTRAAALDDYSKSVFFADPGVTDLIRAKFVPLRMVCDEKFGAAVGLRKPDFIEPGFIVLTPEGRVVHTIDRIRTFNADWLRAVLVEVLRRNDAYNRPAGDGVEDLIRGGDDDQALPRATPDQKAAILRRAGRHREVLQLPCAPLHKGIALAALDDFDGARRILEKEDSPEALYVRAAIDGWTGKDPERLWKALVEKHPASPWARRAAPNLVVGRDGSRQGAMAHLAEDLFLRAPPGPAKTTVQPVWNLHRTVRDAVEFLLRAQQPDGSWNDTRYCYGWASYMIRRKIAEGTLDPTYKSWPDVGLRPNVLVAVTGAAALALAERREHDRDRIDLALLRAEAFLQDDSRVAPGQCEECYAELFRLLYFVRKGDVPRMNKLVRRLANLQDRDGFWGHEYPSAFATAAVVQALTRARTAGADVPEILFRRAADALLTTRRDGGVQDYRHEPGKPRSTEKNSMGRTASSELALYQCGRGSLADIAAGVESYWKHREKLEAIRTCDNHADEELAGFFYFYAVYHTQEAARALEEPARGNHLRRFRDQVLALREIDGSFVDSHELGKSYGTAMALLILGQDELSVLTPEEQPRRMLNAYLVGQCEKSFADRQRALAALKTPDDVSRRQRELRSKFLEVLGGFPERTPLNPKITGTLKRDGYRIEKVIYEARPDHHVTANLYVPDGKGPFPGILFPLGHYDNPKPAEEYQRTCIHLVKNGFAVLTYDPIGQGERYQTPGPRARGTSEHTLVDVGALLVGTCSAQYFIWEGMRGLDYLESRPEIDPKRLGCMGNSGGGTITSYLMALDERVASAVPNCFITSVEKLYTTVGPQDGEASLRGLVAAGFGHSDYFLLRAPRPSQVSCPTRDYYDIEGAWTTFREAKRVYATLGHSERMDLFEFDDKHSISKPFREAATRWMRRWLMNVDDAPVEADGPVEKPADLQCTASGQVLLEFREKTTYDFTADRERELAPTRGRFAVDDVRKLIAVELPVAAAIRSERSTDRVVFETEPGIRIPGLVFRPRERTAPLKVLYVHGAGKRKEALAGGAIETWTRAGHEVVAIDLRGMGETEPEAPHRGLIHFVKADWKEAYIALSISRPLLGQRVRDLLSVAAALDEDGRGIHVVAVGSAAPVALHAALLDPRIRQLTLEEMVISWSEVARTAITVNQLTNVVPGALKVYDLPDLAAALAPRPLSIQRSTDPAGKPVPQAALEEAYRSARSAYGGKDLVLEAREP